MSYERDERVFADRGGSTRMTGLLFAGSLGIPTRASAALGRSEQQVLRSWRLCESIFSICPCHSDPDWGC
jgi:hypothetical protein